MWEFLNGDRWTQSKTTCKQAITQLQPQPNEIVVLLKKKLKRDAMLPQIVQMIKAGKNCKAVATALSISTEAVSNALAVHRAARRPPARIDDKSRRKPTVPFVAKYKTIAAEVLRRRKAGEVFEQIARATKASMRTIRAAHAFAMQANVNESPSIKSKMDDVAEAVAAVKRDLIGELPKMRRVGRTDVSNLAVSVNSLTPVSEPLYAVA